MKLLHLRGKFGISDWIIKLYCWLDCEHKGNDRLFEYMQYKRNLDVFLIAHYLTTFRKLRKWKVGRFSNQTSWFFGDEQTFTSVSQRKKLPIFRIFLSFLRNNTLYRAARCTAIANFYYKLFYWVIMVKDVYNFAMLFF